MTIQRKPTSRAQRLLDHHRLRGRAHPALRYWERLHLLLSEEAEKRGKSPPPPVLHGGIDAEATEDSRMQRFDQQVAWADKNQLLHRVQMFLDAMPSSGWEEKGRKRGPRS